MLQRTRLEDSSGSQARKKGEGLDVFCLDLWKDSEPLVLHKRLAFTTAAGKKTKPFAIFLRCTRSSSWPCRSEDLLLVKRKCNNCKRPRYHGSLKRQKPQQPTQKKTANWVPRQLGENVKRRDWKFPLWALLHHEIATLPTTHKFRTDHPCTSLSTITWWVYSQSPVHLQFNDRC